VKFHGAKHLMKWLQENPDGRKILDGLVGAEIEHGIKRDRRLVLIVLDAEGLVEVYAGRGVNVVLRQLIDGDDDDYSSREEYLRQTLPPGMRHLYNAKHQVNLARCQAISPEAELAALDRKVELGMLVDAKLWPPKGKGKR
jgi:hypothetical protein